MKFQNRRIVSPNCGACQLRIVQEITSWNEVAGAESAKPWLAMNSNKPWRRGLRHSHPPNCGGCQLILPLASSGYLMGLAHTSHYYPYGLMANETTGWDIYGYDDF